MNWLNKLRRKRWAILGRKKIRQAILNKKEKGEEIRIILGAGHHYIEENGWICTDLPQFDITDAGHWNYLFKDVKISQILAEHVFEHLTEEQIKIALRLSSDHLQKNGNFRIAVPDKNNTDTLYQEGTKPGGKDDGAFDHKVFLAFEHLPSLMDKNSFSIHPLEYFDTHGKFHQNEYSNDKGLITRSKKNNFHYPPIPAYTSLIFDLIRK